MTYRNLLYLAGGLTIGAIAAWQIAKRHYEKKCWEEYDKLVEETFGDDDDSVNAPVSTENLTDIPNELAEGKKASNDLAKELGYIRSKEVVDRKPDIKPYLISEDEFGDCSYSEEKVTWYPAHNVLIDEVGNEIGDPEVVGLDNLSAIDNDERLEGLGYVRNDKQAVDYEVTISYGLYPPETEE